MAPIVMSHSVVLIIAYVPLMLDYIHGAASSLGAISHQKPQKPRASCGVLKSLRGLIHESCIVLYTI